MSISIKSKAKMTNPSGPDWNALLVKVGSHQDKAAFEAKKHVWPTETMYENTVRPCPTETPTLNLTQRVTRTQNVASAQTERTYLDQADPTMTVTINAMEVKVRRSAPST